MSSITDLLAAILAAKKGEEVRGSIHDAIEQCYEDGRAGVNDLQARQLIEAVAAVNEEQAAALEVLQARVEELESGEGGSSQQSTTIDIPTVLVDGGVVENVSVNNNSTTTRHITFTTEFTEAPKVMVAIGKNVGAVSQYGYLSANILYPTVTTTGFDFFLANRTGSDRSPGVVWYAYQPTVKTIDLDITIPETEGMTEAEVREITGPIAAAVDALKTGYDGTTYQTAAEAVRTQINDLHVLIGDEPGTAISADSIGYGDGSVADALDGLNGRLTELEGGGTGGLTADVKAALLACFNHVAWDSDDPTGQSYISALQTALYPPANLSRITAVYTQSGTVWSTDTLDSLKANLVVTAYYSDSTSEVVSNYTLSGTLTAGTRTITASYGGKTATFTVVVTQAAKNTSPAIAQSDKRLNNKNVVVDCAGMSLTEYYDITNINKLTIHNYYTEETAPYNVAYTCLVDANDTFLKYYNLATATEQSKDWSAETFANPATKMRFSLFTSGLTTAYAYDTDTGNILFAGSASPYYGMDNISEASV